MTILTGNWNIPAGTVREEGGLGGTGREGGGCRSSDAGSRDVLSAGVNYFYVVIVRTIILQ